MTTTDLTGRNYRITFLTERLVRLEYQSEGRFEDRPMPKFPAGGGAGAAASRPGGDGYRLPSSFL